jgi:hypothetical protein
MEVATTITAGVLLVVHVTELEKSVIRRAQMLTTLEAPTEELLLALSAKADYNFNFEQGGEIDYPHWADDVIRKYKEKE